MDPNGKNFTMYLRESGTTVLPYFINRNFSNGTIAGIASVDDIGDYSLEVVGVESNFWETPVPFILSVVRKLIIRILIIPIACYYKCS
jgi:hypothetical protein